MQQLCKPLIALRARERCCVFILEKREGGVIIPYLHFVESSLPSIVEVKLTVK